MRRRTERGASASRLCRGDRIRARRPSDIDQSRRGSRCPPWARRAPAAWSKLSAVTHRTTVRLLALAVTGVVACGGSSSGSKCSEIVAAYATTLSEARSCNPATPGVCSATRPDTPDDVCRCEVAVNPPSMAPLDQLLGEFQAEQCPSPSPFAIARAPSPYASAYRTADRRSANERRRDGDRLPGHRRRRRRDGVHRRAGCGLSKHAGDPRLSRALTRWTEWSSPARANAEAFLG